MFGLFKRKPKVPSHLTSDEEPQPFVWMHRVIRRPSPPVVWPLESEAFHGWRVKPNPELGLERDTYFLNANAPEFTFATPWPITTRAFLDSLSTDVLHKPEHWSKIDPRDVFLYDADEVRAMPRLSMPLTTPLHTTPRHATPHHSMPRHSTPRHATRARPHHAWRVRTHARR